MSKKLLKSAALVSGFTLISRILGFIRDVVIAYIFGASTSTDAFLVAYKIPNFMRRLFAEGAFSQAFTPILSEYKTQQDHAEVKHLVAHVAGNLGSILLLVTVIGIVMASLLVMIFAPGFLQQPEKFDLTVTMLQITFPYLWFIALAAFSGAILNTYGQFGVPAFTPVLLNLCLIGAALWFAPYFEYPIMALAYGASFAGIVQLGFQLPFLYRLDLLPKPRFNWHDPGVKRVYRLMIPALFGVSVSQINLLIDTLMASFLITGSVSWLYYSDRLMEFPLAMFGIALATVMLPDLSKAVARGDMRNYNNTLDWALRWVFVVAAPSMMGLIILAVPILATLFHHGEFSDNDVMMTARSLVAYAFGLLGFVLVKVLASGFFSRQDTRTPVKIAVIAMTTNIFLNLALIWPLQHAGLALATSLAALLNAGLLYRGLRKQKVFQPQPGWLSLSLRIFIATGCMTLLLWWGSGSISIWLNMAMLERALYLFGWIIAGIIVYFVSLVGLGFRLHHLTLK
ncbi:murein biosynthesis integral membrane protein MurJ [Candidatus Parabeggiatoa sp. HSG14]|uniref:murein biosynthesis integral membrane protein MurJ n=1 Tax=Candidatus Parabeggiatoa sp. HSG14 TaxID=3055593 RepID=UPI0025A89BCF|nr:murein biosynthesis integral membrane protein MurJ [Thiotrichales bacterium HSG14]